jgi:hypothetical protein
VHKYFLSATALCTNKKAAHIPINVNMPNGTLIQSSHTSDLLVSDLPPHARNAHIFPGLVHNSYIYVGELCDSGCNITFTKERVTAAKEGRKVRNVRIPISTFETMESQPKKRAKMVQKSECNHAYETSNQKELINSLHAGCFSSVKSTWITAIKNGNFTSWPGLT